MRNVIVAIGLVMAPLGAWAQAPAPTTTAVDDALQQKVIELTSEALGWRVKAIEAERQVKALQVQLDEAKAAAKPPAEKEKK